ncbi:MAG: helix-turn-helix transcriptional regulator [Phascolarctobacterium sp.]|nr:helix-turn-helix transcriptional regulator [Phascolarctobacterium sp.]
MKITDIKDLGELIKKRRKDLGYTQADISDYTGLSISFISDVEHGKETVELGKVLRLVNILGMDCIIQVRGES